MECFGATKLLSGATKLLRNLRKGGFCWACGQIRVLMSGGGSSEIKQQKTGVLIFDMKKGREKPCTFCKHLRKRHASVSWW